MIGANFDRINALFDRRFASRPSWAVLAELFLGVGWLRAAVAKMIESDWWSGGTIVTFVADHQSDTIGWYQPVIDHVILDYSAAWAFVVIALELAIGAALLTSRGMSLGLAAAIFLNVNFLLVGSPNPSVFYLMLQLGLVLWLLETSAKPAASLRWLRVLSTGGIVLAVACLPYVRTVDPGTVIDDPASVLGVWAVYGAMAAVVARRRVRREQLRVGLIDLTNSAANGVASADATIQGKS